MTPSRSNCGIASVRNMAKRKKTMRERKLDWWITGYEECLNSLRVHLDDDIWMNAYERIIPLKHELQEMVKRREEATRE